MILPSSNDNNYVNLNVNIFIENLISVHSKPGKQVKMNISDIINLNHIVRKLLMSQPMLVDVKGPLKVCGDIHGQYYDLLRIFHMCGFPDEVSYLFLGDYVDRGKQGLESICLLFAYKIKYPDNLNLLRGNHESSTITRIYGFYDECKRRYNVKLWKTFMDTFNCLPVSAIIEDQIFCCHGGLSPEMLKEGINTLDELKTIIRSVKRPMDVPDRGMVCDLMWSDPWYPDIPLPENFLELKGWRLNERGVSYQFAPDVIDRFLLKFGLVLVIRAHQVVEDGYEFYANRSLVTVFSAPNYCGEFDNAGAIFCLRKQLVGNPLSNVPSIELFGSFQVLRPRVNVVHWSKVYDQ